MALNDNTTTKQTTQKRVLIATLLSFAFFIAYDFLYLQPQQVQAEQQKTIVKKQIVNITHNLSAPQVQTQQNITNQAPINPDISNDEIISKITTKNNIIEIDNLGRISQVTLLGKQYITEDGDAIKLFAQNQLKP